MLIRWEGTEVAVIKYQVPRIVGVIEPTCVELGQLSQQFLRCLILVTFEWQESSCFVKMADRLSTSVGLGIPKLPVSSFQPRHCTFTLSQLQKLMKER